MKLTVKSFAITSSPVLVDFSSSLRLVRNMSRRQEGFMAAANLQLIVGDCRQGRSFRLRGETRDKTTAEFWFSFVGAQGNSVIFSSRWGEPEDEEAQLTVRKKIYRGWLWFFTCEQTGEEDWTVAVTVLLLFLFFLPLSSSSKDLGGNILTWFVFLVPLDNLVRSLFSPVVDLHWAPEGVLTSWTINGWSSLFPTNNLVFHLFTASLCTKARSDISTAVLHRLLDSWENNLLLLQSLDLSEISLCEDVTVFEEWIIALRSGVFVPPSCLISYGSFLLKSPESSNAKTCHNHKAFFF